jgi:mRNA-degrading endonuclease RelE of RelBE toxin-antitoxin system
MFITSFGEQNITYKCCSNFLIHLSKAVITVILSNVKKLEEFPLIGKIYPIENKDFREFKIKYGSSGYVCLYSFNPITDIVLVHAFRHQRELGYSAF